MKIKLFADGADKKVMLEMYKNPLISGLTTNPTLMAKAGITNYKEFALDILSEIKDAPISFEVFSDDIEEMYRQGLEITSWASNVYVKIPITNTNGESTYDLIERLAKKNVKINVTAITTIEQVKYILPAMIKCPAGYISIFAGRIADTGKDPLPTMIEAIDLVKNYQYLEILWASSRELYNIIQADEIGCHIITITNDIFKKISMIDKDLTELSLDTVKMFYRDSISSGFSL
jgi:transaldolase